MSVRSYATLSRNQTSQLCCDVCSSPAQWRQRTTSACCAYGEILCERCEGRSRRRWTENQGSLGQDFADLKGWVQQKLTLR